LPTLSAVLTWLRKTADNHEVFHSFSSSNNPKSFPLCVTEVRLQLCAPSPHAIYVIGARNASITTAAAEPVVMMTIMQNMRSHVPTTTARKIIMTVRARCHGRDGVVHSSSQVSRFQEHSAGAVFAHVHQPQSWPENRDSSGSQGSALLHTSWILEITSLTMTCAVPSRWPTTEERAHRCRAASRTSAQIVKAHLSGNLAKTAHQLNLSNHRRQAGRRQN